MLKICEFYDYKIGIFILKFNYLLYFGNNIND